MALVGDLKDLNIATIIQLNCVEKNTADLTINARKGPAKIYFAKGDIIHASYAGEKGEDALYKILSLSEGEFRVTPTDDLPERTIFTSWESLLLEGMRVLDEAEKGKAKIAEAIGVELDEVPEIRCYAIASKKGELIATNRTHDGERLAAAAALLAWKGREVSSRMALGEMSFSTLSSEKNLTFFSDCGGFLAAIVARKSAVSERLYALVDNLRSKLKYCELTPAIQEAGVVSEHQPG
jgi:predicted regulator of Ras-like GTPase activity (Roadblock/LC7/MglB family)